jgi:hypothetical protein
MIPSLLLTISLTNLSLPTISLSLSCRVYAVKPMVRVRGPHDVSVEVDKRTEEEEGDSLSLSLSLSFSFTPPQIGIYEYEITFLSDVFFVDKSFQNCHFSQSRKVVQRECVCDCRYVDVTFFLLSL